MQRGLKMTRLTLKLGQVSLYITVAIYIMQIILAINFDPVYWVLTFSMIVWIGLRLHLYRYGVIISTQY